ncbi:hypothetical protein [Agrococcus sp. DT81.2]|uniref:hypothetical protein n=1 Tax=Agrococcus sp. DT81.2 TaxID=3393414 RepID=UPI003CE56B28
MLRLGLTAGAASIGAVALSLLLGAAPASASDHDAGGLAGLTQQLGGVVGAVVETATDPVRTVVDEVGATTAPIEHAAEVVASPIVELAAPVVRPVVQAPAVAAEVVRDSAAPVTDALAAVMQPLAPVVEPVERAVDAVAIDIVLDDAVVPVVAPVIGTVGRVVGTVPVVGELLGEAPVADVIEPVIGTDLELDPLLGDVVPGGPPPAPGSSTPTPAPEPEATSPEADVADVADASAPDGSAAVPATRTLAREVAPWPMSARIGPAVTASAEPSVAVPSTGPDRDVNEAPLRGPDGVVPSAASGTAAGVASSLAVIQDHPLPAVAAGRVGALESDRAPSSPAEEHTASPD